MTSRYDRWLTEQPDLIVLHHGRPTECDLCEGHSFSWHPSPRKPENAHYRCVECDAHYYINEVGAFDPAPDHLS